MRNRHVVPEIRELLAGGQREDLVQVLEDLHPSDAASILAELELYEITEVMSLLPLELERDAFNYFEPELQEAIVLGSGRDRVKGLLTSLASDDRADFMDGLDYRVRAQLFPLLSKAAREDLLRRSQFEDDQVGAMLSTEYCVLDAGLTPAKAMEEIRLQAPSRDTVYYSYVTDAAGKLIGFVSLKDLITADPEETVRGLMKTDVVSVRADDDQEKAAQLIRDYDLIALPVVDGAGNLVGIVTHDDAIDIVEEEDTEDVEKMAGVTGESEGKGYMEESVGSQILRRAPIIMFLAVFFVVTATVLAIFKKTLDEGPQAIVLLLPMVLATGGMVGTQASSLVIRALAVGNLRPRAVRFVLWKEVRIGLAMGVALGAVVFGEAWLFRDGEAYWDAHVWQTCWVLSLAMTLHVLTAAVFGATIPLLAKAMRGDPANVSTPAVTALADLSGALIYLIVASSLLDFPPTAG